MGSAERKQRQKAQLREQILEAAREIVVKEGFRALSMRKLADAVEYAPATLYLHFQSRDEIAREQSSMDAWLDEWVHGTADHAAYVEKFGDAHWDALRPDPAMSGEVDYGRYA